jgi:molybdopterin/thiamine biosynthesis adenylyltransferase
MIKVINRPFEPADIADAEIVIAAVDVMSVRKEIIDACTPKTKRFIDCRMMSMAFEIYSYIPEFEKELYMMTRFPDEEATSVACTNKSSSFNTFAIAGFITRFVVGITKNEKSILDRSQLTVDLSNLIIA